MPNSRKNHSIITLFPVHKFLLSELGKLTHAQKFLFARLCEGGRFDSAILALTVNCFISSHLFHTTSKHYSYMLPLVWSVSANICQICRMYIIRNIIVSWSQSTQLAHSHTHTHTQHQRKTIKCGTFAKTENTQPTNYMQTQIKM